ncbi:MAG: hypothetical protein ACI8T1_001752 [Verrucomicrobiales bacterium]|jgi:hypothetical protein
MAIRIFFALLTLVVLGLAIASSFYIIEKVEKPKDEVVREIKEATPPKPIDPGIREFDAALALLRNRQLIAGRDKLRYIIRYFPKSERYAAARRICSEMNLDMLISPNFSENKTAYEVKRGDVLSLIANKHGTTIECIARVNGLSKYNISPGDHLDLLPLDFTVEVSTKEKKLTLSHGGEFFAEYDIGEVNLPKNVSLPLEDQVRVKLASIGQMRVSEIDSGYDGASKKLILRKRGLSISPTLEEAKSEESAETGIFMDPVDIAELTMLLRVGTPIRVAL